ncbi:hypothetical protein V9T40_000758 [Parthenolecanium corni]|uniref:Protein twisted gastrulation n=1 Tax=Parthenolecanium corni TaxID=536013 RepID=A0AAN9TBQ3_9HEMI
MIRVIPFACFVFSFYLSILLSQVDGCNDAVCASVVSKCLLTQACKCDLRNCTCCKDCSNCLSGLWTECCSCVELCPKPDISQVNLTKTSQVEDLPNPIPTLFQSLVSEPDTAERWFTLTFPVDYKVVGFIPELKKEVALNAQTNEQEVAPDKGDTVTFNCSVAYMSQCMPSNKCKRSCESMGATSYRWFHIGCCECVGDKCLANGLNESRCKKCPNTSEDFSRYVPTDLDYGEED